MRWPATVLILPILAGCASGVQYTPYQELELPPTSAVEVLQEEPGRPYEVLGEMWVLANDTKGVLRMRKQAMKVGADAIILTGERGAGALAIPLGGATGGAVAVPITRSYAVAIRYKG